MTDKIADTLPAGVIMHDDMLWRPRRGATATADEFIAARTVFKDITQESRWNPWVRDDRNTEYEQAIGVMDQWRRADPGHRMLTDRQLEARFARQDREREQARAKLNKEREARTARYDKERANARLALLEHQSVLDHEESELVGYRDGSRFPLMDSALRKEKLEALEQSIVKRRTEIERLSVLVGDPETVIDQNGWLPWERRDYLLLVYRSDREQTVRRLRTEIRELEAAADRKDRVTLDMKRRDFRELLAVPPLSADDMCSDCPMPLSKHGWVTPPYEGPCPAWPGWAARIRRAREMIENAARWAKPAEPRAPKPEPLAVIPSGLPIAELTKRLMELEKQFPDAEVRRGRANRWELWPGESAD